MKIKFWGTRGSAPVPGKSTLKYGGNTSCIEVREKDTIIIIDAGTGIRELGRSLVKEFKDKKLELHILISHTHWDHIHGIPFFQPAYIPGNKINFYGVRGIDMDFEKIIKGQMDTNYFPVDFSIFRSHINFVELNDKVNIGPFELTFFFLNHPGITVGFRLDTKNNSIAYVSDNEPYSGTMRDKWDPTVPWVQFFEEKFIKFIKGVDLLLMEGQYTEEEYERKVSWGHGTMEFTNSVAQQAEVKKLAFFHYDPEHTDKQLDARIAKIKKTIDEKNNNYELVGAVEGMEINL
ncbi:MBL fold metallo-hydrolase [candidate division KSB1 bacterium]